MVRAIIFDLDGTLADTIQDIRDGLNGMLLELGLPEIPIEKALENINNGATELVRRSLPPEYRQNEDYIIKAKKIYDKHYSYCYNNKTKEFPGCKEALKALNKKNISISVLSNKQDVFVKEIISKLFHGIKFDFVLGQGNFPTKPDPASANFIIRSLNLSPDSVMFVGDSNVDMITAKSAGAIPVGVSWGYRSKDILIENGAKYIIASPSDIPSIINLLI